MTFWKKARMLWRRRQFEADLAEEIRLHREAVGAAAFGSEALALEEARSVWGFGGVDSAMQDLKYALRCWRRAPGFALTVIATIGLALGLNTTLFTVFNAYVLRPLAVKDPYSLYSFWWVDRGGNGHRFSWNECAALRQTGIFTSVMAYRNALVNLDGEPVFGQMVSSNLFRDLGVGMYLGRALDEHDSAAVVLSHATWQRRYGADPLILGRKLYLRGNPVEVVGIASPDFGGLAEFPIEFWVPPAMSQPIGGEGLTIVARLRPGMEPATARAGLLVWARQMTATEREDKRADAVKLVHHATMVTFNRNAMAAALPVFVAFGLVLLLACANVSNMMLARALSRQREIGIRVSLGAGRTRLVRQLLTESLLLSLPAAAAGFAIARLTIGGGTRLMYAAMPPAIAKLIQLPDLAPDIRVFGFILAASLGATVLFGLVPAIQTTRSRLIDSNRGDFSCDHRPARLRSVLVVTQVTVCALLLISAAVLLRSEQKVVNAKIGLDTHNVFDFQMPPRYRAEAVERMAREPVVEAIASDWNTPLYSTVRRIAVTASGAHDAVAAGYNFVTPEYFAVFRIPVRRGRLFNGAERGVVMVSESTARRLWPGRDAIGETLVVAPGRKEREPKFATARVIAVVGDVIDGFGADERNATGIYFPTTLKADSDSILVRVKGEPNAARRRLEAALDEVGRGVVDQINPMDEVLATMSFPFRMLFWVAGILGGLALVLTATGIYGVMSYLVSQRTKEIGIRVALGADAQAVLRMVMRQSMGLAAVGVMLGAACALAVAPLFAHQISAIDPFEPWAYAGAVALVGVAALGAAYHPARRAVEIDPVSALRCD